MNKGKYIFSQVLNFLPRQFFLRLVKKYKGDYRVRDFNCTNQLHYMLSGQLTPCNSLRDICMCLKAYEKSLYAPGIKLSAAINVSTLSRANENRDYHIYEGLGMALIKIVRPLYSKTRLDYIYSQEYDIFALDSTTISCSVKLMEWAAGEYSKGAVKMHTIIDLRGSIPAFIYISDGRFHDSNILDFIEITPESVYVMDKAYVDFEALHRIDREGGIFITRAKNNMKYEILSSNFNIDYSTGLLGDHNIQLTGYKSSKIYPKELRLIVLCNHETGEELSFITNAMNTLEFNELEIANIYRHRWEIEVFFKWIKQNLSITHLLGHSENAVKTHLWIAICAYLLLAKVKAVYESPYSITEIATLVSISALVKRDLRELVTGEAPDLPTLFSNQNVNELNIFNQR